MFQILESRFTDEQLLSFLDQDSFYANHYRSKSRKISDIDKEELSEWLDELNDLHDSIQVEKNGDLIRLKFDEVIIYSGDVGHYFYDRIGEMPIKFVFDGVPGDNCFSVLMTSYYLDKSSTLVELEALFLMFERVIGRIKIRKKDLLNAG